MSSAFRIQPVRTAAELAATGQLFREYAASLTVDLGYQGFAAELAGLPGLYAPPRGGLLLARDADDAALACVALRPLGYGCCEMKRLYVAPRGRGRGLGRAMVEAIIAEATRIGYREMRLDSLPSMTSAIALYRQAGFVDVEPYYGTPVAGTVFLSRLLQRTTVQGRPGPGGEV